MVERMDCMAKDFRSVILPSKCLAYENVDPSKIQICQLTGEEERILSEISTSNFDRKILEVLRNVLRGIEPERLTLGDRLYILVWEAMNCFSDDLPVTYECVSCENKITARAKFSRMENVELPDSYVEPIEKQLSGNKRIKLRLLTAGDEAAAVDYENKGQDGWSYRYASSIVNGEDIFKRIEFYKALPIRDTTIIRMFQDEYSHGPDMQVKVICPRCGVEEIIFIPFRIEFLFPTGPEFIGYNGDRVSANVVVENAQK
jgi:hypothetical protein